MKSYLLPMLSSLDKWISLQSDKQKLIVIYGPTGSGKTTLSLDIAQRCGGEVISADSRQIYREISIGTGKIQPSQMRGIRHHGIDLVSISESYSAGAFASYARDTIGRIAARGRLPILCGGTGLYLDMTISEPTADRWTADPEYRSHLEHLLALDPSSLHRILMQIDPNLAETLHPNATRHIMGALEYHHSTGKCKSEALGSSVSPDFLYDIFWLTPYVDTPSTREDLYSSINKRISEMMSDGLLDEYDRVSSVYASDAPGLLTIGYRECALYRSGQIATLPDLESIIAQKNRNYAKRQITWNKKYPCDLVLSPK